MNIHPIYDINSVRSFAKRCPPTGLRWAKLPGPWGFDEGFVTDKRWPRMEIVADISVFRDGEVTIFVLGAGKPWMQALIAWCEALERASEGRLSTTLRWRPEMECGER